MIGTQEVIVVKCADEKQLMIIYGDLGITLARGRRDSDATFVIESKEVLSFAENPELVDLYFGHAWDVQELSALTDQFCWDGSKT